MEHIENLADKLGLRQFTNAEWVKTAAVKTNAPPILVVFGVFVVGALSVLLLEYPRILFEVIFLFLYPAYKSLKALQTEQAYDDRRWLTYWIVFGLLFGFDTSIGFLLRFIPLWGCIRIVFLVYILVPGSHGAELVFEKAIRPIFNKYSEQIDGALNSGEERFKEIARKAKEQAANTIANNLLKTNAN